MSDRQSPIIRLEGITKRFPGVVALNDVSFDISPGEIHAVLGENGAGKSTLMNILAGELHPDEGRIVFEGQQVEISNPFISQQLGISVVYQELALCLNLSIAENISLNATASYRALSPVRRRTFNQVARDTLDRLGLEGIDVSRKASTLPVAQQQLVEIAKAISQKAKVLILDEPNSALTIEETERLFTVLDQLRAEGVAIIYVSHRLEEVLQIADRMTVLRDGLWIETMENDGQVTIDDLIARMVGRAVEALTHTESLVIQEKTIIQVKQLTAGTDIKEASLYVRAGEVVGVAGLPGCGKDELVDCLFGLRAYEGDIIIQEELVDVKSPTVAIEHGLALVPADRRGAGALLLMNVHENLVSATLNSVSQSGFLQPSKLAELGNRYMDQLDIRAAGPGQRMGTLSGGNQQKAILGRGLATQPSALLLHEPTRGIDVGAKAEIYTILHELAEQGVAILIVSSELPELIGNCDRIYAMHQGRITGHFSWRDATEEQILACAMGQLECLPDTTPAG